MFNFTELLTSTGIDIFYIGAILMFSLFFFVLVLSVILHEKHIQFYRILMRKDYKPSKLSVTWLCLLPVIMYQSLSGDHQITTGIIELIIAVFIAELAVQGIDLAGVSFGRFSVNKTGSENNQIQKKTEKEIEAEALECHCPECEDKK